MKLPRRKKLKRLVKNKMEWIDPAMKVAFCLKTKYIKINSVCIFACLLFFDLKIHTKLIM